MPSFLYALFTAAFAFVCVFLILLILIQKGRGGGLSSAFGGAGGNTAFGSKTGDVLTWVTSGTFVVFIALAMLLIWTGDWAVAQANSVADPAAAGAVADDAVIGDADEPEPENRDLPADTVADQSDEGTFDPAGGEADATAEPAGESGQPAQDDALIP